MTGCYHIPFRVVPSSLPARHLWLLPRPPPDLRGLLQEASPTPVSVGGQCPRPGGGPGWAQLGGLPAAPHPPGTRQWRLVAVAEMHGASEGVGPLVLPNPVRGCRAKLRSGGGKYTPLLPGGGMGRWGQGAVWSTQRAFCPPPLPHRMGAPRTQEAQQLHIGIFCLLHGWVLTLGGQQTRSRGLPAGAWTLGCQTAWVCVTLTDPPDTLESQAPQLWREGYLQQGPPGGGDEDSMDWFLEGAEHPAWNAGRAKQLCGGVSHVPSLRRSRQQRPLAGPCPLGCGSGKL